MPSAPSIRAAKTVRNRCLRLRVLFEDNHCLAVNKPAGLLTQGVPGIPTMEAVVRDYIKTTYSKDGNVYLGVPHRLDRPVSGVMLFAKTSKAAQRLAQQFRERQVNKVYWGIVDGVVKRTDRQMERLAAKIPDRSPRAAYAEPGEEGRKQAILTYKAVTTLDGGSVVEFVLETGRMHQIRLQSSLRGHPLWGDELYGSTRPFWLRARELLRSSRRTHRKESDVLLHPIRYEPKVRKSRPHCRRRGTKSASRAGMSVVEQASSLPPDWPHASARRSLIASWKLAPLLATGFGRIGIKFTSQGAIMAPATQLAACLLFWFRRFLSERRHVFDHHRSIANPVRSTGGDVPCNSAAIASPVPIDNCTPAR